MLGCPDHSVQYTLYCAEYTVLSAVHAVPLRGRTARTKMSSPTTASAKLCHCGGAPRNTRWRRHHHGRGLWLWSLHNDSQLEQYHPPRALHAVIMSNCSLLVFVDNGERVIYRGNRPLSYSSTDTAAIFLPPSEDALTPRILSQGGIWELYQLVRLDHILNFRFYS